jgi:uncharacterized repeat protein (TIGR03803 family)
MNRSTGLILGTLALTALITGCGGKVGAPSTPQLPALQVALQQNKALASVSRPAFSSYKSLYSFKGPPDGASPSGGLIAVNGALYGTTNFGGRCLPCSWPDDLPGYGTVFEVSVSGTERVIYRFPNGNGLPSAGLIEEYGVFYGTTSLGSNRSSGFYGGTVFEVSRFGAERVLHRFSYDPMIGGPNTNGGYLYAGLIAMNGSLYGTTSSAGNGTVFAVRPSGTERVVYRFKGGSDGINPSAALIAVNGAFYGTTVGGGTNNNGTVFAVSPSGTERVVYRFKGGSDGAQPYAGLIAVNGALYGTTSKGGTNNHGTVFAVNSSGAERVLYSFKGRPDGSNPRASLIEVNGALYGTTYDGGTSDNGTVFKVSP